MNLLYGSLTSFSAVSYPIYQLGGLVWHVLSDINLQEAAVSEQSCVLAPLLPCSVTPVFFTGETVELGSTSVLVLSGMKILL